MADPPAPHIKKKKGTRFGSVRAYLFEPALGASSVPSDDGPALGLGEPIQAPKLRVLGRSSTRTELHRRHRPLRTDIDTFEGLRRGDSYQREKKLGFGVPSASVRGEYHRIVATNCCGSDDGERKGV